MWPNDINLRLSGATSAESEFKLDNFTQAESSMISLDLLLAKSPESGSDADEIKR